MKNRFWTVFGAIAGGALLVAVILLWWTRGNFADAEAAFRSSASEQRQLEGGNPYPSEANVRKMRGHLADYHASLDKLRAELGTHVLALPQLQPNEFQSRLLEAITATISSAREHRVKLPENFKLGFDEFVSNLPKTEEAPGLGQELEQIELLVNMVIEARVDGITMFRRVGHEPVAPGAVSATPTPPPRLSPANAAPASASKMIGTRAIEFTISAPPSAARKIVNGVASANDQFFIMRTLHVKSQKDKGPARAETAGTAAAPAATPPRPGASPSGTPAGVIQFVVGNEHIDLSARVELVDFTF
jgi:hypothetical protein